MSRVIKSATPFQLLPELPSWEFDALKASILKHGEHVAGIEPSTVDLVLTDVPYNKKFAAENFDDLAEFCNRVLKPGGILCIYLGVIQVAEAINSFTRHLSYQATAFSAWLGDGPVIQSIQCVSQSTPVLVFSKGKWDQTTRWYNTFYNEAAEQDLHPWQKPLADVEHWLLSFSEPGDLVCDPCCGSGSTAVCGMRHGRRFVGGDIDADAIAIGRNRLSAQKIEEIGEIELSLGRK